MGVAGKVNGKDLKDATEPLPLKSRRCCACGLTSLNETGRPLHLLREDGAGNMYCQDCWDEHRMRILRERK